MTGQTGDSVLLTDSLAGADPRSTAIDYFGTAISYGELDKLSTAVAHGLAAHGVAPGDRVGLLFQNDPQLIVSMFAAWRAGAVVVPLNPMLRPREIATVLSDSGARALISLESSAAIALASGASLDLVVTTSELEFAGAASGPFAASARADVPGATPLAALAGYGGAAPPSSPVPDALTVLAYTSGTTGPPKGAMLSHHHLATAGRLWRETFGIGKDDVILALSPLFHVSGLVGHIAAAAGAGAHWC